MSGEALHSIPEIQKPGRKAQGYLHLFAATLLCRPLEPPEPDVDALVRSADLEASRMADGARIELAQRDHTAFRLVYRAIRDRAARVRPGEIVSEPRWMRAVSALSWLRHRQRAALILDAMTPLTVADIAEVTHVSEHEAERIIGTAVASVARALGRPTDVRADLEQAAKHLRSSDEVVPIEPGEPALPRRVVRLLLDSPPAKAPEPPTFAPDMTPVDALLARSEAEPADITFAAPTPPKPPVAVPAANRRRPRRGAFAQRRGPRRSRGDRARAPRAVGGTSDAHPRLRRRMPLHTDVRHRFQRVHRRHTEGGRQRRRHEDRVAGRRRHRVHRRRNDPPSGRECPRAHDGRNVG